MRTRTLPPAALALGLLAGAAPLYGQSTTTSTAVSAEVVNGLTVTRIRDIDFGVVPGGSGVNTLLATDPGAGEFHLFGENGRTVTVTITAPLVLTSGPNTMPFVGAASVNESADDPAGAVPAPVGPSFTMKLRDQGPTRNGRLGYLFVHGSITVAPTTAPGVYRGTVTVVAEQ